MSTNYPTDTDVLVIGAGVAGLAAARAVAQTSSSIILLEAQSRIGGRIHTQHFGSEAIELGAEFVHGRPPELLALISEAGLDLVERSGSTLHANGGSLESGRSGGQGPDPFAVLEQLEDHVGPDLTFAEFLSRQTLSESSRAAAINFVEGFNAADHHVVSVAALGKQQKAEDAIDGDLAFHITGGYDQLPAFLASELERLGGELRLDTAVRAIKWQAGRVSVATNQGDFTAARIIIAVPLGVLQADHISFNPPLPQNIRQILTADGPIRMGHALRFTLLFRDRFWTRLPSPPDVANLSFLISPDILPPVWWTPHPEESNTLTGWVGGPRTALLTGLSSEALADIACNALSRLFQIPAAEIASHLVHCSSHDWLSDPHALGAYSYIAKDGLAAPAALAEPIADTLYFAGEHTATDGHWGTVHAALDSGLRAASQVSAALNTSLQAM